MSYDQNSHSFDIILLMVTVMSVNGGGHFSMAYTFPFHHLMNCLKTVQSVRVVAAIFFKDFY